MHLCSNCSRPTTSFSDDGEWKCITDCNIITSSLANSGSWFRYQSLISSKCVFQVAAVRVFFHNENVLLLLLTTCVYILSWTVCGFKSHQDVFASSVLFFYIFCWTCLIPLSHLTLWIRLHSCKRCANFIVIESNDLHQQPFVMASVIFCIVCTVISNN